MRTLCVVSRPPDLLSAGVGCGGEQDDRAGGHDHLLQGDCLHTARSMQVDDYTVDVFVQCRLYCQNPVPIFCQTPV